MSDPAVITDLPEWQQGLIGCWLEQGGPMPVMVTGSRPGWRRTVMGIALRMALERGEHVHVATPGGAFCAGGNPGCSLPRWDGEA